MKLLKYVSNFSVAIIILVSQSAISQDLSRTCFNPRKALNETKPKALKTALRKSHYFDFLNFGSGISIRVGEGEDFSDQSLYGRTRTIYYDIAGTNKQELIEQIKTNFPVAARAAAGNPNTTDRVDAATFVQFNWLPFLDDDKEAGFCTLRFLNVDVNVTYWFPRWTNMYEATMEEQKDWREYMRALSFHERGHAAIGYSIIEKAKDDMLKVEELGVLPCNEIRGRINSIGRGASRELAALNLQYDDETLSGATQGARYESRDQCYRYW